MNAILFSVSNVNSTYKTAGSHCYLCGESLVLLCGLIAGASYMGFAINRQFSKMSCFKNKQL